MDTILPAVPVIAFHVQIGNGSARTYALSPPPLRALLPRWEKDSKLLEMVKLGVF
jgi:hypothetical protein